MKIAQRQEIEFFKRMALIRHFEESLLDMFSRGLLGGTVHTCLGQEAIAVGVVGALERGRDIVCTNHRGHGHYLAYYEDPRGLAAEIMGRDDGICRGVGGSQHLHRPHFFSNGILAGMAPVAAGIAFAEKLSASNAVTVLFIGDGATAEGAFYEAMNLAALWSLPLLIAIEHNQYAQSTHWSQQHSGKLQQRAEPFGIPLIEVDGNDVNAVFGAAQKAVREVRQRSHPAVLFLNTYRLGPHSKGDDLRSAEELSAQWERDPLRLTRMRIGIDLAENIEQDIRLELKQTIERLLPT